MCSNISTETTRSKRPGRRRTCVHVRRDDLDVAQAALAAPRSSMKVFCGPRVRHGHDRRAREVLGHPERQRAPAASELEDALPVGQLRPPRRERQHRLLGLGQRRRRPWPERAAVLEPRPEDADEEGGRHFVVLRVGGRACRSQSGWPRSAVDVRVAGSRRRGVSLGLGREARLEDPPDAGPDQRRRGRARSRRDDQRAARGAALGGQGTNALVVR